MFLLGWYLMMAPPGATQGAFHPGSRAGIRLDEMRLFNRASQYEASRTDCEHKPPETLPLMLDERRMRKT